MQGNAHRQICSRSIPLFGISIPEGLLVLETKLESNRAPHCQAYSSFILKRQGSSGFELGSSELKAQSCKG